LADNSILELFWKLFEIAGGGSDDDITKVLDSIVKSDRAKLDQYFTDAIDQIAFDTQDWKRLREFLIDLFSSHRALITNSAGISDPHLLSNDDLDELFRSFGFTESVSLKNYDNNPLENKVQLFLDLVNLYKIKGTPRSILEVLQYYGIPELDIFEFWLQKEDPTKLIFKGDVIVGTSVDPSSVYLPYDLLTEGDPHWMMSENQILHLDALNKINLPSKSPYFAVQPVVEVGIENSLLVRTVQDQYFEWDDTGDLPPQDAEISLLGVTVSLLELYLLTLYSFQKDYDVGSEIGRFTCYDGTNTDSTEILQEYQDIISPPITRDNKDAKWAQYIDLFTREREEHFLYNYPGAVDNAAEVALNDINPALIPEMEALTSNNTVILQSLLKDLALWVRNNIGYGFVNLGYIFFGLNQLFEDLKPVINFFKPYRARLIVLELIQFNNILSESIPIEDSFSMDIDTEFMDVLTASTSDCWDGTSLLCLDSTSPTYTTQRDTYDCDSFFDIGAVDDDICRPIEIHVDQYDYDTFRCPTAPCPDCIDTSTSQYENQRIFGDMRCSADEVPYWLDGTSRVISIPVEQYVDATTTISTTIDYTESAFIQIPTYCPTWDWKLDPNYVAPDGTTILWVTTYPDRIDCTAAIDCTSVVPLTCDNVPYVFSENVYDTFEKIENLEIGTEEITVVFDVPLTNDNYLVNVNLFNNSTDSYKSMYGIIISDKTTNGFTVKFSSPLDSVNYKLSWSVNPNATIRNSDNLTMGQDTYRVDFDSTSVTNIQNYSVATAIVNEIDSDPSIYNFVISEKDSSGFEIQLSGFIDSTNYDLEWSVYANNDSTSSSSTGLINIPILSSSEDTFEVEFGPGDLQENDKYSLALSIVNTVDTNPSVYSYLVTKKNNTDFSVKFSGVMDSTNYYLSWHVTNRAEEEYLTRQESGFRLFDTMGRFDCTHGFDMVEIYLESVTQDGVIIQEDTNGNGWILQEAAIDEGVDDYGLLWE
jgi:methionine-rich copper-binding protein CopC